MKLAIILFALVTVVNAGLFNPAFYPISLYGGFSYASNYEALRNYHRARYYARKAHDLAKLRSGLYGVGNGFYGYRYGSTLSKWSRPYPAPIFGSILPSQGVGFGKSYVPSVLPPEIGAFPLGNYYNSKGYGNSYSQNNFAYGKGTYSNKNSNFGGTFVWPNPNIKPPSQFFSAPIPVGKTTPIILDSGVTSFSPGYQYSYFVRGPNIPKIVQPSKVFSGYDSLYGTRYPLPSTLQSKSHVIPKVQAWNAAPVGTVVGDAPLIMIPFSDGSIYNSNYNGLPNTPPVADGKVFGLNPYSVDDSFGNTATYSLLPPSASDFSISPLPYDLYSNPSFSEFSSRYDTSLSKLGSSQDAVPGILSGASDLEAYGSRKLQVREKEKETKTEDHDSVKES